MSKSIILRPRVSEKAYALSEALNTYVFDVSSDVNKHSIADSVTAQYEVAVTKVRIASIPGKAKRSYRKRGRNVEAQRSDIRKAYVTLKAGDSLPIFAGMKEAAAEEAK